jgi:signal peptide peptidase SppA
MTRRSVQDLLCEPLMIDQRALYRLFDECRMELEARAGRPAAVAQEPQRPAEPVLEVTMYDGNGARMTELETSGQAPGSLIAVVPLAGVITRHGYYGWFSSSPGSLALGRMLQKLDRDEAIAAIVLSVDSPGGSAYGTPELSEVLFEIRKAGRTKTIAVVDPLMASAATYVATAAEKVYAIPTADVGSIGVISSYTDYSRYLEERGIKVDFFRTPEKKARFTGYEPLSEDMRKTTQDRIDQLYDQFVADMARNRKVSEKWVKEHFGQGELISSAEGVENKLIDGIVASIDEVIADLTVDAQANKRRHARKSAAQRLQEATAATTELQGIVTGAAADETSSDDGATAEELTTAADD